MKSGNSMSIKVVELFAGVGGFRVAMENVSESKKVEFVWANQWEPGKKVQHAFDCYTSHFGISDNHVNDDIAKVKQYIPDHDLLVGGFPCQDYSVAATGAKGIEGKKGVLWWEIRDIIENKRPRYVLLENVDRLLKSPASLRGRDFAIMLRTLEELGYGCEWRVLNAAEHGFTQRRRRVFIFAFRSDSDYFETHAQKENAEQIINSGIFSIFTSKVVSSNLNVKIKSERPYEEDLLYMSKHFKNEFLTSGIMINGIASSFKLSVSNPKFQKLGSVLESDVNEKYYVNDTKIEKKVIEAHPINVVNKPINGKDKPFAELELIESTKMISTLDLFIALKDAKRIPRIKPNGELYYYSEGSIAYPDFLDQPARTLLTSESSVNRSTHLVRDPQTNRIRILTPVECERLNGFPDNWTNTGMPEKFRYFTMGNALVVPLVRKITESIIDKCKDL
jgi:DNA (cytosine-5)-methyltransferase 1